jgi:hypothetical protein
MTATISFVSISLLGARPCLVYISVFSGEVCLVMLSQIRYQVVFKYPLDMYIVYIKSILPGVNNKLRFDLDKNFNYSLTFRFCYILVAIACSGYIYKSRGILEARPMIPPSRLVCIKKLSFGQ